MNTIKRFWALCLDTHMELALYKYAIIIIIIIIIITLDCIKHPMQFNWPTWNGINFDYPQMPNLE